jgi:translation initiation factor IF-1
MAREGASQAEGVVVEVLRSRMCRLELANGHRVLEQLAGEARLRCARLFAGDKVCLEVPPCDLSAGRIVVET